MNLRDAIVGIPHVEGIMKRVRCAAAISSALVFLSCSMAANACFRQVAWMADLSSGRHPAVKESGTAEMKFDFEQPFGTLTVQTKNVRDVESIDLRRVRFPGDLNGPVVAKIYRPQDGPYRGKVSKVLRQADVIPLAHPVNDGYTNLADEMLHQCIVVAVCTKAHPQGEILGLIRGRLVVIYSAGGSFHDAALHQHFGPGGL